jgi:anti-sigma B factor antagonist
MLRTLSPRLLVETIHGVTIATFADAEILTEDAIGAINDQLQELVEGLGHSNVLLNFRDVRLMSSTMLGVLLKFARRMQSVHGRLKLCCIAPDLMQAFKITRFDRLFEIYADEATALDSFA